MYSGMQSHSYFSSFSGVDAALRPLVNISCARGAAEKDHWYHGLVPGLKVESRLLCLEKGVESDKGTSVAYFRVLLVHF